MAGKRRKRWVLAAAAIWSLATTAAACPLSSAPAAAAKRLGWRLVCEDAWHAMVAAPRRAAEHHCIAAAGGKGKNGHSVDRHFVQEEGVPTGAWGRLR